MKMKLVLAIIGTFFLVFSALAAMGDDIPSERQPIAFLPESTHEFSPVVEGTQVMHEFVLQNKGTLPLMVEKVLTG